MNNRIKVATKKPETKINKIVSQSQKSVRNSLFGQILFLQKAIGNQTMQGLFKAGVIQAKLIIGQPNDIYEQEAHKVAEQVMRMPENKVQTKPT